MTNFTPLTGFFGGCLIGLAAILFLVWHRRVCGISGMLRGLLPPGASNASVNLWFIFGLFTAGLILHLVYPIAFEYTMPQSIPVILLGGFLVGFGSSLGNGCTSGHGVCGIGRLSTRSFVSAAIFFITALLTASIIGLL